MVDTTIALQSRVPDILGAIQRGAQVGGMFAALGQQKELLKRNKLEAQQKAVIDRQNQVRESQKFRVQQAAGAYQKIKSDVDNGNFKSALRTLESEKELLNSAGVANTPDIDAGIQMLGSNDPVNIVELKKIGDQAIAFAKQTGAFVGAEGDLGTDHRAFEKLISGFTEEEKEKARKIRAKIVAPTGISAPERIALSEKLTGMVAKSKAKIEGDVSESKAEGKAAGEFTSAPLVAAAKSKIAKAVSLATEEAKGRGETLSKLGKARAALPGLQEVVEELRELAQIASTTIGAKAYNFVVKQSGFGATKGSTARAKFSAVIGNQILKLLKDTFGASFTVDEKEELKATLGSLDSEPEEKMAELDSFIDGKIREMETLERELGLEPGAKPGTQDGVTEEQILEIMTLRPGMTRAQVIEALK